MSGGTTAIDEREQQDQEIQSAVTAIKKDNKTMNDTKSVTKDPICGMTVDETTALHAERDGKTFYFCSDHCRQKFLPTPAGAKPVEKSGGCCG